MSTRWNWNLWRAAAGIGCVALLLSTTACDHAVGDFHRTLQVSGPVSLRIGTGSGDIHVMPGGAGSVQITGHIRVAAFFSHAQARLRAIENNPPIEQSGTFINIGHDTPQNVSISYDVTVPPGSNLIAHSGSGNLRIVNVAGSTDASTGSGNIQADGLGGHVVLHTGSGSIHAGFDKANDVNAETGSGGITLKNVQGILVARAGSGDIDVSGAPFGGWNIRTGSGNVTLHTGAAHYFIDALTGSGSVYSNQSITLQGSTDHHHLTGNVNGGGPAVHIVTGSGDIRLR